MISNEIDEKKTKYFVIAIILLIILSVFLVLHFNNKSLVRGETENEKTTAPIKDIITTEEYQYKNDEEKVININKQNIKEENSTETETLDKELIVYKSTIDEVNKFIYNYKLTEEIQDNDTIISTILDISESLKNNNIIGLYDISVYDSNMVKKTITNSLIDISIPITNELNGYDEYKIVYIDNNDSITDEEFKYVIENGYIKFSTKHLSKFGIIGIKKEIIIDTEENEIDLTNVTLDVKINNNLIIDKNIYVNTTDTVDVIVNNLDREYKLYYLLTDEEDLNTYQEFKNNMFESINTPSKYTLVIKLVVDNTSKDFEIGNINVYDIVFAYDKDEEIKEDIIVGEIKDEEGNESTYINPELNKDIVIDVVEEKNEETVSNKITETQVELNTNNDQTNETNKDVNTDTTEEKIEMVAKIILKGNIYLVEETDISALEMTGHLTIDTNENITFDTYENKLLTSNIYTITIKSKEFSFNGVKYKYEYKENKLIIKKVEDNKEINKEDFENLFDGYDFDNTKEEMVLNKNSEESNSNNVEDSINTTAE